MQEKRPSEFERLINDAISGAFHSGDFRQLKNMMDITSKQVVNQSARLGGQLLNELSHAIDEAQKQYPPASSGSRPRSASSAQRYTAGSNAGNAARNAGKNAGKSAERVYPRATVSHSSIPVGYPKGFDEDMARRIRQASGQSATKLPNQSATTVMIIAGIIFASLFLDVGINFLTGIAQFSEALISFALAGIGIACTVLGFRRVVKRRVKQYRQVIGSKQAVNIADLAKAVGKSQRFVLRDLKKLIKNGTFPQGHFDDEKTLFILTDEAYEQYRTGQANRKLQQLREARIKEDPNGMEAVMAEGEEWVAKIRRANDALPGEEISRKLDQLESVTRKIFATVEKKPEKLSEIRRFMNYYLPTTVKLVGAYQEFEAQPAQGANIQNTKQEILDILDTVNNAFGALLDSLYEHDALDISSDITVLKNMLAQEGLTEKDFSGPSH